MIRVCSFGATLYFFADLPLSVSLLAFLPSVASQTVSLAFHSWKLPRFLSIDSETFWNHSWNKWATSSGLFFFPCLKLFHPVPVSIAKSTFAICISLQACDSISPRREDHFLIRLGNHARLATPFFALLFTILVGSGYQFVPLDRELSCLCSDQDEK